MAQSKYVCVGGPLDGKLVTESGPLFHATSDPKLPLLTPAEVAADPVFEVHTYVRQYIRDAVSSDTLYFYAHQSLSAHAVFVRVFAAYARSK